MNTSGAQGLSIRSYRDFRRLISGQTSRSMAALYDTLYFEKHVGDKEISGEYFSSLGLKETKYTCLPLALAEIELGDRVLDVGCGRGEIVFQAAARARRRSASTMRNPPYALRRTYGAVMRRRCGSA